VRRKERPAPPPPLATTTAERLAAIVEAAERAAVTVIDDAEQQARRHLEAAEAEADRIVAERLAAIADLTDSLIAQTEEIDGRSQQLVASLEEVKRHLAGNGVAAGAMRPSHLAAVAPAPEAAFEVSDLEGPAVAEPAVLRTEPNEAGSPAGARLLATQMAVSGNSRAEIDARLRHGFDIEDTTSILDAILGAED
jgi:vacuolar-type H+-ATPase subunit H